MSSVGSLSIFNTKSLLSVGLLQAVPCASTLTVNVTVPLIISPGPGV